MSNDLVLPKQNVNTALLLVATYLPYLKFFYGMSDLCKQKKFPSDTFGLVRPGKDTPEQLGEQVDLLFLAVRSHALDMSGKTVVHSYNIDSESYKSIRQRADTGGYGSNCMYGPEFLVYLVGQDTLAHFHLGNKSLRFLGSKIMDLLPDGQKPVSGATLKTKWIDKAAVPFMGVEVDANNAIVISDTEKLKATILDALPKFLNPVEEGTAPEAAPAAADRG